MQPSILPIFLSVICGLGLCLVLLALGRWINPRRASSVKRMPYESGVDPHHDARRRVDVRFYLLAIAFLVFDVELLFLFPWAVASRPASAESTMPRGGEIMIAPGGRGVSSLPGELGHGTDARRARVACSDIDAAVAAGAVGSRGLVFAGAMVFLGLLALGLVYDWRKRVFQWR